MINLAKFELNENVFSAGWTDVGQKRDGAIGVISGVNK